MKPLRNSAGNFSVLPGKVPLAGIRRRKQGRKGRRRNPLSAAIPAGNQKPNRKNSTKTCRSGVREELRITPAKVERIQYLHEVLACPVCREEDTGTIVKAPVPTALLAHSPASPSMAAFVMYQKFLNSVPFYRQEMDWLQMGAPLARETTSNWCIKCALVYFEPVYDLLHGYLVKRDLIHADETVCQVLHEEGKAASSNSYMCYVLSF